jgi:hypothetical protein
VDYLKARLFDPIGIVGQTWETCPKGINCGGWGLSVKTEDIARFGQTYLQQGRWGGRQVVPGDWVTAATSRQVPNGDPSAASDWTQGYCYQFWRCRHGAFRGDGAFGQYCVVMPELDAVLAITSGVGDMQAVLNAVWDHLLPALQSRDASSGDETALRERIARLEVHAPRGSATSTTAARVSGKTYVLDGNPENELTVLVEASPDRFTLTLHGASGDRTVASGIGGWIKGSIPAAGAPHLGASPSGRIAARGAWIADDTYSMAVCYVETPYVETVTCRFTGDHVSIGRKLNVAFGPTERPALVGRIT